MKPFQIFGLFLLMAFTGRAQTFSKLYDFSEDKVGVHPILHLVQGADGRLYGETFNGSGSSFGTVFALNPEGSGFTNIVSFNQTDGAFPKGGLIISGNTLYGTTYEGANGYGTVFAVNTDGTGFTNLFNFSSTNGSSPEGDLLLVSNVLYGTTAGGGPNYDGTIFSIHTDSTGFTNIYFSGADGAAPEGGMVISGNKLYGTTYGGGVNGDGSVFAINTDGTGFTNLFSFANYNGYFPIGDLVLAGNRLYGTTFMGGLKGYGCVFAINTDSTGFTNLFSFTNGVDGINPSAGLVLSGHTLFGTASSGGAKNWGTVFAIHTDGSGYSVLYTFTNGVNDGSSPSAGVILSSNILYGTASTGGTNGTGTIYSLTLPPVPTPTIKVSSNKLILAWPTNALNYTLSSSTNLGASANWSAVTNVPSVVNGSYTVTNLITGQQMFYYLSQ